MLLWNLWWSWVEPLRDACSRSRSFLWLAAAESGSLRNDSPGLMSDHGPADPGFFPPELVVQVKALVHAPRANKASRQVSFACRGCLKIRVRTYETADSDSSR